MLSSIDHRGPDGTGSWVDKRVGIGHQQLQSTPESRYDDQPSRTGDLILSADARIDNRSELLDTLPFLSARDRVPDSQLLLEAYRQWGPACVDHLIGAFAFVIWDAAEQQLFCARDHLGVKPFYYHLNTERCAVASEIKAILTLQSVPRVLDEVRVGDFLIGRYGDKTNTLYESIRRLPPAHAMVVTETDHSVWQYWDLDPTQSIDLGSDQAYETRYRELLEEAVRCRLRTDGAVGTELSGGLDSSPVTVVARDLLPDEQPLHTFSNAFDDAPRADEQEYIDAIVDQAGIIPHYVNLDGVPSLVDIDQLQYYFDRPPHHTTYFGSWERAKWNAQVGVDVVLSGNMGDAVVGHGYSLFTELARTGRWRQLFEELRAASDVHGRQLTDLFTMLVLRPFVPNFVSTQVQRLRRNPIYEQRENPILNPAFVKRIGLRSRYKRLYVSNGLFPPNSREQQYRSIMGGMFTEALELRNQVDAAFGIETRHPYADKRLIEFSLAIPPTQQFSDGYARSIARRSLDDLLPEKVQWRTSKATFGEPFYNSMQKESERLDRLLEEPGPLAEYLDMEGLRKAAERFEEAPNMKDGRALWRALSLWVWFQHAELSIDATAGSEPPLLM